MRTFPTLVLHRHHHHHQPDEGGPNSGPADRHKLIFYSLGSSIIHMPEEA